MPHYYFQHIYENYVAKSCLSLAIYYAENNSLSTLFILRIGYCLEQFNEVKKVENISLFKIMLTHYIVTLQNGKKIAVHLMVINEWLLSGTEVLPDLMVWIIEEIKIKECLEAYPLVLFVKNDTITQESQSRFMSIVDVMQRRC